MRTIPLLMPPTNKPFFPNLKEVKKVVTPQGDVLVRKMCKCGAEFSIGRCDFIEDLMEARVGIEPTYKGFADLSLTTWVPRL